MCKEHTATGMSNNNQLRFTAILRPLRFDESYTGMGMTGIMLNCGDG